MQPDKQSKDGLPNCETWTNSLPAKPWLKKSRTDFFSAGQTNLLRMMLRKLMTTAPTMAERKPATSKPLMA